MPKSLDPQMPQPSGPVYSSDAIDTIIAQADGPPTDIADPAAWRDNLVDQLETVGISSANDFGNPCLPLR